MTTPDITKYLFCGSLSNNRTDLLFSNDPQQKVTHQTLIIGIVQEMCADTVMPPTLLSPTDQPTKATFGYNDHSVVDQAPYTQTIAHI